MRKILSVLLILVSTAIAEDQSRTLRISTWPADAEIYVGERPDSFVREAAMRSPDSLKISPEDSSVRITLFKPGYADTTIDIRIKAPGKNFIWIELEAETNLDRLDWQENILGKRERRRVGKILFFSSFAPIALSGAFAGLAWAEFDKARNSRKKIEQSGIRTGDHYEGLEQDFDEAKKSGKGYRTASLVSLGIGAVLLSGAAIFYF